MRRTIFYMCRSILEPVLGHLQESKMCPSVLFGKPVLSTFQPKWKFMNLVLICPSKSSFSQDCFLCVKIGVERSFLGVFDLLETQIMPKFLVQAPVVMIFHVESKNASHFQFGAPNSKRPGRKNLCCSDFGLFLYMHRAQIYTHRATLEEPFGGLPDV